VSSFVQVQQGLFSFSKRTFSVLFNQRLTKNHKGILFQRMKRSQHGDNVNGDVAKHVPNRRCIAVFSRITEF